MKKLLLFICCLAFVLVSCASGGSENEISNSNSQTFNNEELTEIVRELTGAAIRLERSIESLEACVAEIKSVFSLYGDDMSKEFADGYGHRHDLQAHLWSC